MIHSLCFGYTYNIIVLFFMNTFISPVRVDNSQQSKQKERKKTKKTTRLITNSQGQHEMLPTIQI